MRHRLTERALFASLAGSFLVVAAAHAAPGPMPAASNSLLAYGISEPTRQSAVAQQLGSGFGARYQRGLSEQNRHPVVEFLQLFGGGAGAALDLVKRDKDHSADDE